MPVLPISDAWACTASTRIVPAKVQFWTAGVPLNFTDVGVERRGLTPQGKCWWHVDSSHHRKCSLLSQHRSSLLQGFQLRGKKSKTASVKGKAHVKLIYLKKKPLKRSIVLSLITLPNADNTEPLHRKEVREMTPFHTNEQVAWA